MLKGGLLEEMKKIVVKYFWIFLLIIDCILVFLYWVS